MAKPFTHLSNKLSPQAKAAVAEKVKTIKAEMHLQSLRQARQMSQERMADLLSTKQANISRIERRTDMYISTLRSYIEAMGGQLEIIAKFPEDTVYITQFSDLDNHNNNAPHAGCVG